MKRTYYLLVILVVFQSLLLCNRTIAYELSGSSWPSKQATLYSTGGNSNATYNAAFVQAMNYWNNLSDFSFFNASGYKDPCADPNNYGPPWYTGYEFRSDMCGTAFGGTALAVNRRWVAGNEIIQAGTMFNTAVSWDVHSGSGSNYDFRRVAAHELGHAFGLSHSANTNALMYMYYSTATETPQTDDINGIRTIYGNTATTDIVYRFWNSSLVCHFFTINEIERNRLVCCDPTWALEGSVFRVYGTNVTNTVPVYRFWSNSILGHFFTASETEKDSFVCCNPAWNLEGIAYYAYASAQPGTFPVYRFKNNVTSRYFYTISEREKDRLICCDATLDYEGIAYYVLP